MRIVVLGTVLAWSSSGLTMVKERSALASRTGCVSDPSVAALGVQDMRKRVEIQTLSAESVWKMPGQMKALDQSKFKACGSCQSPDMQVEMMKAQMGESPDATKLLGVFYPFQPSGERTIKKSIENELVAKLDLKAAGANAHGYNVWSAKRLHEFLAEDTHIHHFSAGLGSEFERAHPQKSKNTGTEYLQKIEERLNEYGTHLTLLEKIDTQAEHSDGIYMILNDGFMVQDNFAEKFNSVLHDLPKDWDVLLMSTESGNLRVRCEDAVPGATSALFEARRPVQTPDKKGGFYRGVEGYIVRRRSIPKLLAEWKGTKAVPLQDLLMSVHKETMQESNTTGMLHYNTEGHYTYVVSQPRLIKRFAGNGAAPTKAASFKVGR